MHCSPDIRKNSLSRYMGEGKEGVYGYKRKILGVRNA